MTEKTRVLLMEDDRGLARQTQKRLERCGNLVDIAGDGEIGLAMYEQGTYDVLAVDNLMPNRSGMEVIRILSEQQGELPPTIMITGSGDERTAVEAIKLGASDYLVKDISGAYLDLLPTVIERVLEQRRLARQKRQAEEALRQSELRYRTLFESAPAGIGLSTFAGRVRAANDNMLRLTGYSLAELLELDIRDLYRNPQERTLMQKQLARDGLVRDFEVEMKRKDDQPFFASLNVTPIQMEGEEILLTVIMDITKRKRAQEQVAAALREKEVLLREIHHRVKNSMQVIVSLLRLHARRINDPQAHDAFSDCQNRIQAMALIHETLCQSPSLAHVGVTEYLGGLVRNLTRAYSGAFARVSVTVDAGEQEVSIDQAVPLGMIINELVSNALEHAFPEARQGEVRVSCQLADDNRLELVVSDNGIGMGSEVDPRCSETMGLRLVMRLAEDQLGGKVSISADPGTTFTISFNPAPPRPIGR